LEKFPGFGRKNSQTSDLAAAIGSNLAEADTQNAFTSGGYRPVLLKNSKIFLVPNLFAM
jgi:hypothetical protein